MISAAYEKSFSFMPLNNEALRACCGPLESHIRAIEQGFGVTIERQHAQGRVMGDDELSVQRACAFLLHRYQFCRQDPSFDETAFALSLRAAVQGADPHQAIFGMTSARPKAAPYAIEHDSHVVSSAGSTAVPNTHRYARTEGQALYWDAMLSHEIVFGIGVAGTGKTFLAVAKAVQSLLAQEVKRIILVRPAVEAGERLGFLPGDMNQKVDPYLRPLFDALHEHMGGAEKVQKAMERQQIEIAPLAYMRGRTLQQAFIILDEAQNTTPEQMKMFLTRLGWGSRMVITGDLTQIDLPRHQRSGLLEAQLILNDVAGIAFCGFSGADVVRHPLVQKMIEAYDQRAGALTRTEKTQTTQVK